MVKLAKKIKQRYKILCVTASLVLAVVLVYGFFVINQTEIYADSGDNLSGYAWSENIGWVSFNCTNASSCAAVDYGVKINLTGQMSGFAWSENIGWIDFNEADLSGCPSGTCKAEFDSGAGKASGWARACAGTINGDCKSATRADGWDGWIHLADTTYGVAAVGCNWDGYAWGSDVIGWIHFKGSNYGLVGTGDACKNEPPQVSAAVAQAPTDYCAASLGWTLNWVFSDPNGNTQSAYQIIITDKGSGAIAKDTGEVLSSSTSYAVPAGTLDFNKTYSWTVKVWENSRQRMTAQASGDDFTTLKHAPPAVSFTWTPERPAINEVMTFSDAATVFGGSTKSAWKWTLPADAQILPPTSLTTPQVAFKFTTKGSKNISLTLTDSDGLFCTHSGVFSVGMTIPRLKEIIPKK